MHIDSKDLRFADSTLTNELSYEIESWDTNGNSYVWVRVLELTNNATLNAWWGNAAATQAPPNSVDGSTWAPAYDGVWHLAPGLADASGRSGAVAFQSR